MEEVAVQSQYGGAVLRLRVPGADSSTLYATNEGVEEQAAQKPEARFKTTCGAPICMDPTLHQDFGFVGNTDAVNKVFDGTYEYPEGI